MIRSFADMGTADVYYGRDTKVARRLPKPLWPVIRRKLDALHRARTIQDLRLPAGNRLEALKGDRIGCYSVRVNEQYRITFQFEGGSARCGHVRGLPLRAAVCTGSEASTDVARGDAA